MTRLRRVTLLTLCGVLALPVIHGGLAQAAAPETAAQHVQQVQSAQQVPQAPPKVPGTDVLAGTKCQIFPVDNVWHADISALPVSRYSAAWLKSMSAATKKLHPDFGPSYGEQPLPYGIPITIAPAKTARVAVRFDYADESDRIKYPLTAKTLIEGGPAVEGDRHAIIVTADTCELFETYDTWKTKSGWVAGSGSHWSLKSNALRPAGWTSADAAGLPILPGLLRWAEVKAGSVNHAIRVTTNKTAAVYVWPARHQAGKGSMAVNPPMGARFRLKANFNISRYSAPVQTILRAMKTYGLILADNGSPWFFQGDTDKGWPEAVISELKKIPASAFEAVDTASLVRSVNSGQVRPAK